MQLTDTTPCSGEPNVVDEFGVLCADNANPVGAAVLSRLAVRHTLPSEGVLDILVSRQW